MGLTQEGLRRTGEIRNALAPVNFNPSEIKTNRLSLPEAGLGVEIREISRMLFSEGKKIKETEAESQTETPKQDGFEPFVNPQPSEDTLFVNDYNGNFTQKMELNRKGIERVLKIAHLDGQVFLTTLSPNRQKSIEANPDGSVSAKRNRFFGEKTDEDQEENLLSRVVAVPQGWRIEINDRRLTEELTGKKLSGTQLQKAFVKSFNGQFKETLRECIWREKFSNEKDKYFKSKVFWSLSPIIVQTTIYALLPVNPFITVGITLFNYGLMNLRGELRKGQIGDIENILKKINPSFSPRRFTHFRQIDSFLEYFMPLVEIDKVLRSAVFLSLKARTLVKEKKPKIK